MAFPPLARSRRRRAGAAAARALEGGGPLPADAGGQPRRRRRSCSTRVRRPPTAVPGIHHVFSRTIKDLVCRFHAMQGKSVTRIAGWDTHGLPVEIEVEKELKLNGKKEIEEFGVRGVQRPRAAERLQVPGGMGVALRPDRRTGWTTSIPTSPASNDYVESVWWLLARLHEKDLLYRGHRVLPYCPRCGTVLSSHELALGLRGRHHQLDLRDLPAGRRLRPRAAGVDHHAVDAAVQRGGRGASRAGVRRVRGRRTHGSILATARGASCRAAADKGAPSFAELGARRTFPGSELVGLRVQPAARRRAAAGGPRLARRRAGRLRHRRGRLRAWCTWRRRSAPTTTRPAEHGLALVRPVGGGRDLHRDHLARDRGPAGHRQGDQRSHHPAAQARRPLAPDPRRTATATRTAGAAPAR